MEKYITEMLRNKNYIMLTITGVYILGLYAFFTDKPIVFGGIFTVFTIAMALRLNNLKFPLIYFLLFYFGFFYANYRVQSSDMLYEKAPSECSIVGRISSVPTSNGNGKVKFFLDAERINEDEIKGRTLVTVKLNNKLKPESNRYLMGNKYIIKGKLRKPFTATNPSQFSYDKYLRNFNVYTTFYTNEDELTQIHPDLTLKYKILRYLNVKREDVITSHSKYLKSPNIEILGGVVFGDDAIAPPDYIKTSFIHSGLLHILAASGMNVAFIAGFLFFFLDALRVPFRLRTVCGMITVIFYALMTGLGASVVRAALMLLFVLAGKLIDRDAHSVALLSFVALLMLIYNPAYINDVGFQLSFIVTFGIMVSADPILKYFRKVPGIITGTVFIPIIAQLWVIPIQMFYFNTISIYSVFANIISMPFLSVISFGGFISSVFALISPIADMVCRVFDYVLNPCLNILVRISTFFSNQPHSLYTTTHPSIIQILLYYVILLLCVYFINNLKRKILIPIMSLTLILWLTTVITLPNRNFEVIAFDVGNADTFLLRTPKNHYYIIDSGKLAYDGGKSQAEIIILKYLRDRGIKDIEGLIITHYDSDHAGGAVDLIKNLAIKRVYVNTLSNKKRLSRMIAKAAKETSTVRILAKDSELICREEDFQIKIIKPDLRGTDAETSDNENSVMALAEYKKNRMLFTGDAGVRALKRVNLPDEVTVLKVGHHGARGVIDKELMSRLNPKASLISVGYNKYGHPSPVTMKILERSRVVRTDKMNAIKVIFYPDNKYLVGTYNPKSHNFSKRFGGKL